MENSTKVINHKMRSGGGGCSDVIAVYRVTETSMTHDTCTTCLSLNSRMIPEDLIVEVVTVFFMISELMMLGEATYFSFNTNDSRIMRGPYYDDGT